MLSPALCNEHWWTIAITQAHARWPAALVELIFNAVFLLWALLAARRHGRRAIDSTST